ncbi:MAG: ComEA family DNA-binding protein [Allomuricauda sp.]
MEGIKSHFKFNKQERSGIFFLLFLVVMLQGIYYFTESKPFDGPSRLAINTLAQARLDSLKGLREDSPKIFPFNPNYINDHKGYALGMSTVELDRLLAFREKGNYINSVEEFQLVTGVSDSLLTVISPYFKFPVRKPYVQKQRTLSASDNIVLRDINSATAEDLRTVYGIGEALSTRILKFRDRLGGFLVNEQLYDVYGLEPEVVKRTLKHFQVLKPPKIDKINVNTATVDELSGLVYIDRGLAQRIVAHRQVHGAFTSLNELTGVKAFPADRIERIKLYLTL